MAGYIAYLITKQIQLGLLKWMVACVKLKGCKLVRCELLLSPYSTCYSTAINHIHCCLEFICIKYAVISCLTLYPSF